MLCVSLLALVSACGDGCGKKAVVARSEGPSEAWLAGQLPPEARGEGGTPKKGGTLTLRLPAEPPMLNRLHDSGQDGWMTRTTFGQVVETLLELDRDSAPDYRLEPLLAERWELSEDGLRTTFHLRRGVRFHDGQPFTSRDAAAVLGAVQDPKNPTASMRGHIRDLARYETPDPHTLVLHWKTPSPVGVRNFALNFPMVPASALKGDFDALAINRAPVGTGPFRFEAWETGRHISFVRNDDYWGQKAHLDRVELRVVKDHTVATQMFERGEFDVMTFILPSVWRALEQPEPRNAWAHRGYHRIRNTENAYNWLGWNQQRPLFADVRVRRAMTHLLPMDVVHRSIFLELEPPTTCPFFTLGPHCDPALEAPDSVHRLRYDRRRAQALLAEAGFRDTDGDGVLDREGKPFRFTFLIWAHSVTMGKLAPLLQEELRRVGVVMDIERVEWAVFTERLRKHDFDLVSLGWSTLDVETDTFHNFHSSQIDGGGNYVGYANPELDALLEQSRRTFDEAERVAISRRIHRIVYEDQVYTFLGVRSALDAAKTRVRGLRPSINWYRLADVWLEPEA
jgi:peptide/nickel transport system substrate-binding protein